MVVIFPSFPNFKLLPCPIPAQQEKAELLQKKAVEMNHFLLQFDSSVLFPFPVFRKVGKEY